MIIEMHSSGIEMHSSGIERLLFTMTKQLGISEMLGSVEEEILAL